MESEEELSTSARITDVLTTFLSISGFNFKLKREHEMKTYLLLFSKFNVGA